jgi:hypothetical protein
MSMRLDDLGQDWEVRKAAMKRGRRERVSYTARSFHTDNNGFTNLLECLLEGLENTVGCYGIVTANSQTT